MNINFKQEVQNHKEDLLKDLFELLSIRSILDVYKRQRERSLS